LSLSLFFVTFESIDEFGVVSLIFSKFSIKKLVATLIKFFRFVLFSALKNFFYRGSRSADAIKALF